MLKFLKSRNGVLTLVVLAIVIAGFLAWRSNKKSTPTAGTDASAGEDQSQFPLKVGSRGKEVEQLQIHLLRQYGAKFPKYGIDGVFGSETLAAVQKWLKKDTVSKAYFEKVGIADIATTVFA